MSSQELEMPAASRTFLLSWIKTITLADHMGDVSNDLDDLLKKLGVDLPWNELPELANKLTEMGIKYRHEMKDGQ